MSTYIKDQSVINERRMKEVEAQMQAAAAAAKEAEAAAATTAPNITGESTLTAPVAPIETPATSQPATT